MDVKLGYILEIREWDRDSSESKGNVFNKCCQASLSKQYSILNTALILLSS